MSPQWSTNTAPPLAVCRKHPLQFQHQFTVFHRSTKALNASKRKIMWHIKALARFAPRLVTGARGRREKHKGAPSPVVVMALFNMRLTALTLSTASRTPFTQHQPTALPSPLLSGLPERVGKFGHRLPPPFNCYGNVMWPGVAPLCEIWGLFFFFLSFSLFLFLSLVHFNKSPLMTGVFLGICQTDLLQSGRY